MLSLHTSLFLAVLQSVSTGSSFLSIIVLTDHNYTTMHFSKLVSTISLLWGANGNRAIQNMMDDQEEM